MKYVLCCKTCRNANDFSRIMSFNDRLEAFKAMSNLLKEYRNSSVSSPHLFVKAEEK